MFISVMRWLRYVVIFSQALLAALAAGVGMWVEAGLFMAFASALYVQGRFIDGLVEEEDDV